MPSPKKALRPGGRAGTPEALQSFRMEHMGERGGEFVSTSQQLFTPREKQLSDWYKTRPATERRKLSDSLGKILEKTQGRDGQATGDQDAMKLSPQAATSTGFFRGPVSDEARAEEARRRVEAELDSANWSDWLESKRFCSEYQSMCNSRTAATAPAGQSPRQTLATNNIQRNKSQQPKMPPLVSPEEAERHRRDRKRIKFSMFKGTVKPEALGAVEEFVNTANPSQARAVKDGIRSLRWIENEYAGMRSEYARRFVYDAEKAPNSSRARGNESNRSKVPIGGIYSATKEVLDDRQRARAKQLTETLSRFRTEGEEERAAYYRAMKGDKRLARLFATGGISTQHDNLKGQLRIGYKSSDWKSQARATHSDDPHTTTNFTRFKLTKPCRHIDPWAGKTFLT